jgi:hypothetical protein
VILVAGDALNDLVVGFDALIEPQPSAHRLLNHRVLRAREAAFLGALSRDQFGTMFGGARLGGAPLQCSRGIGRESTTTKHGAGQGQAAVAGRFGDVG